MRFPFSVKLIPGIAILLLLAGHITFAQAKSPNLKFHHLTRDQGLTSNGITAICEDSEGFIWFATFEGISRFDGYDFYTLRHEEDDSTTLSSNKVTSVIEEEKTGNLWIGTEAGLNYYDRYNQKVKRYNIPNANLITQLCYWGENKDLIIATSKGVFVYREEQDQIELLNSNLGKLLVQCIYPVNNNTLYIGTPTDGLYAYSQSGDLKHNFIESDILIDIRFIFKDSFDDVWVGSDLGLVETDENSFQVKNSYDITNTRFTSSRIHGMIEMDPGEYYILERDGGLYYFEKNKGPIYFYTNDRFDERSLSSKAITTIYLSSTNILWLGTYNAGISYTDFNAKKFRHYKSSFTADGLFNNNIRSVFQDASGTIYIGTKEGGGISTFDKETGKFVNIPHEPGNNKTPGDDYVFAIEEYDDRYLLLGTLKDGLNIYDRQENTFTSYNEAENNAGVNTSFKVYSLKNAGDGKVWVGCIKSFQLFDFETKTFTRIPDIQNVRAIHVIDDDIIWVAARYTGLIVYSKSQGIVKIISHNPDDPKSLPDDNITAIYQLQNSNFLFATDNGLVVYDSELNFIRLITEEDGLPANVIRGVQEDDQGNIWAATSNGIAKIDLVSDIIKIYDIHDGLQGNEFEYYASCKTHDGEIIFGGRNGFNIFKPEDIKDNTYRPPVKITDFKLFNKSVAACDPNSPLDICILRTDEIRLKHNQNSISFNFAALNFTSIEKVQYKYKLEGLDEEWIETSTSRLANYTNLPHGRFTFMVKASNNDGIWNEEVKSIKVYIKAPFWKTALFRILVILIVLGSAYKIYSMRIKGMRHQQLILETKIKEGEKVVEDKIAEVENQKEEIQLRDEREREMRYTNKGLAIFSGIVSTHQDNLEAMCNALISEVMDYTSSTFGVIYVLNDIDEQDTFLEIKGKYGYDSNSQDKNNIKIGESYVGTCFKDQRILELEDLPDDYAKISSGLGEMTPNHVVLVPLKQNDKINGVMEIASFNKLEQYKVNFLSSLSETISSAINTFLITNKVKYALEKSNFQTKELLQQEEELRQNLEEMQATKEEIQRQIDHNKDLTSELFLNKNLLSTIRTNVSDIIYTKDLSGKITEINRVKHPLFPTIQNKTIVTELENKFLPEIINEDGIQEGIKNKLKSGTIIDKYEKASITINNKEMELNIYRFPILNEKGELIGLLGLIN